MLVEHVQGTRSWDYSDGQAPWVYSHAICFCTDHGREGHDKPTVLSIMLVGLSFLGGRSSAPVKGEKNGFGQDSLG